MTWTYDPAKLRDPNVGALMRVRFQLGDTSPEGPLMQDEELHYLIETKATERAAVAEAADLIATRYAHEATYSVGNLRVDAQARAANFREIAKKLRGESSAGYPTPLKPASPYSDFPSANNAGV